VTETLLDNDLPIRLFCFFGVLGAMAIWEILAPRRSQTLGRGIRWPNNLGLSALNTVLVRLSVPITLIAVADLAEARNWGLLNQLSLPDWLRLVTTLLVLDLAIYAQHVLFHAVPLLWRLHRLHHADPEFDVTTGVRFHPLEILLSIAFKLALVVMLGASAAAILIFEILLNATSLFNHGNVNLPANFDRYLRWVVVTPDMHRVHHSVVPRETNSNFGFNLPWWDHLFRTYTAQPDRGHKLMRLGISRFHTPRDQYLDQMLIQPFRGSAGNQPIRRAG
jgi:sterol desaturase/sphingolipid hydroxylase (fatty acid hydroxylase superfamily)